MAKTVGDNAGRRIVGAAFVEAGREGGRLVPTVCDLAEQTGLSSWPDLIRGVVKGVIDAHPELMHAASVVYGRLAIPFTGRDTDFIGGVLVDATPEADLARVVDVLLACTETDAHPFWRATALSEIAGAARKRGVHIPEERLRRWLVVKTDDAGGDDLDPFAGVTSLAEFEAEVKGQPSESTWRLRRAFGRLIKTGDYQTAKRIFENTSALSEDNETIELLAAAAVDQNERAEARALLEHLKVRSDERGSWGGWAGDARLRYHRVAVKLDGERARRAAFDQFATDLSEGRESIESVLPDLCDALEILSPTVSWKTAWESLAEQLQVLREFRLGSDFMPARAGAFSHPIAELLERASLTTSSHLGDLVHVTARELLAARHGGAIVAELVRRLWRTPSQKLRAAQIAWECRTAPEIATAARGLLSEMMDADDIAVRNIAEHLADALSVAFEEKDVPLPPAHKFHFPHNPAAEKFEPPSGASETSVGLWTDDALSWTWPLETPMRMTSRASGIDLPALRRRAASLMARAGGKAAFGPDAQTAQLARLGNLELKLPYRKLGVDAAFRAMREVTGELCAADELDSSDARLISFESGAYTALVSPMAPSPRPETVAIPDMPNPNHTHEQEAWRGRVADDAYTIQLPSFVVLAATACFRRRYFMEEWTVEQYSGPSGGDADDGLDQQLSGLPKVVIADALISLYDAEAARGVARPQYGYAGQSHRLRLMFCPRLAARLGWRPVADDVFTTLDEDNTPVAKSILWRDGGLRAVSPDTGMYGVGCLLVVREDRIDALAAFCGEPAIARAWRGFGHYGRRHIRETNVSTSPAAAD